jgi:hypothetical protein
VRAYLEAWGKPIAFYSDKHSVFRVNHPGALGGDGMTQFGRALHALNIDIICANSSPAKGRVERANRTLQDRLVKELRLAGIFAGRVNTSIRALSLCDGIDGPDRSGRRYTECGSTSCETCGDRQPRREAVGQGKAMGRPALPNHRRAHGTFPIDPHSSMLDGSPA